MMTILRHAKIIHAKKFVNGCAERAVKLTTDFNEVLTKVEKQRAAFTSNH